MRNTMLLLGFAAALGAPAVCLAATRCQDNNRGNEVAGTVVGAVIGGIVGNAVSHGHSRGAGTAIGVVGGGYIGNRLATSGNQPCPDGYTAYEDGVVYQDDRTAYSGYNQPAQGYATDQYGRQITTYAQDSGYVLGQDGDRPTYSSPRYEGYAASGYTYDQYNRERRAFAANQGGYSQSYSSDTYPSSGYASQYATTWQDAYGRSCYWRNRSSDDQDPTWVQACR